MLARFAALMMLAGGCTTVTIVAPADGRIILKQEFLAVGVSFEKSYTSTTAQVRGFGLLATPGALAFGVNTADIVMLGRDDCRMVMWFGSANQARKAQSAIKDLDGVCIGQALAQSHERSPHESH